MPHTHFKSNINTILLLNKNFINDLERLVFSRQSRNVEIFVRLCAHHVLTNRMAYLMEKTDLDSLKIWDAYFLNLVLRELFESVQSFFPRVSDSTQSEICNPFE